MKKAGLILCGLALCGLTILFISGCGKYPREVGQQVYDARIDSILYESEYSQSYDDDTPQIRIYFSNINSGGILEDGGMWVYNESGIILKAGASYHLVIKVWSDGWGPIYYLESATLLDN